MKAIAIAGLMMTAGQMVQAQIVFRKVETKKPGLSLTAKVPIFPDKTPVAVMTNNAMMTWVKAEQAKTAKQWGKPPKDSVIKEYAWEAAPTVSYYSAPRLASVSFQIYAYAGGAHPNHWYRIFNYGVINGKAKRLTIMDLFAKTTNAADIKQQISDLVLNQAHLDERASFVNDGTVTKLSENLINSFVIVRDGIVFLIPPYEFGPYAAGDFEIKLTLSELGPDFRRSLILAR